MRCCFLLFAFLSTFIALAQPVKRLDGSNISAAALTSHIQSLMDTAHVTGLCISVLNQDQPVYTQAFGVANAATKHPLTPQTVLYGASFSKAVFAYLVMQLVQEKKLDLDKPLASYLAQPLPDYVLPNPNRSYRDLKGDERWRKLTARMCLTHTTGFPNWRWFEADEKLKFKFEPGSRYSYSGEGINLLQFVVEQIMGGISLETLAQERIFRPLGMFSSSYLWQPRFEANHALGHTAKGEPFTDIEKWDEAGAAGSLSTTLEDYTKFFSALLQQKSISKKSFAEMIKAQVRIRSKSQFGPLAVVDYNTNDAIQLSYGLGVGVLKTPYGPAFFKEGHDEGWGHYSIAFPDKGIAVIIMTNSDNGEGIFKELLETAIGDKYTPWQWENYIPYNHQPEVK